MELIKELKEKVQNAKSAEETKKILEEAGMELTDEELDMVSGGAEEGNIQTMYFEFRDGLDGR